ncbi:ECF-type riboflavin transporter, S component [Gottschalkia purinilytica]|uniref:ECF-type riboflavin transporter, S component n=1 Tax=Gottschalkia purinilytica TaxID=1503 RepID=A0A0L0W8X8_GOTPU|nr:CD3073 family putative ECF transporter S component [Gottschalkia purinilytica]KNF07760.1 ECF-type riboflavin transporter, S component [Gottschalkia purinilytica]
MKRGYSGVTLAFISISIAVNIILGTVTQMLKLPLIFLDTIGTIFSAVLLGPLAGAIVGGFTNVILGSITDYKDHIPFAIVNIAIGLIVGFIAKKYKFNLLVAITTGCILSIITPIMGTIISIIFFEGLTGKLDNIIFMWLIKSGKSIFTANFIPRITGDIIDKTASCIIVSLLYNLLPKSLTERSSVNA